MTLVKMLCGDGSGLTLVRFINGTPLVPTAMLINTNEITLIVLFLRAA